MDPVITHLEMRKQSKEAVDKKVETLGEGNPVGGLAPQLGAAGRLCTLALIGLVAALRTVRTAQLVPLPLPAHHLRNVAALEDGRQEHSADH